MGPRVLWTAFALAFTPALVAVSRFVWTGHAPVDRAPLVGAALLAWCAASHRAPPQPRRRDGAALLLAACVLELVGIAGRSWSVAQLALPLGAVGLARYVGAPPVQVAALALFAVPPPYFATALLSPHLEGAHAAVGSALANALGLPVRASLGTLDGPGGGLDFIPADGGVPLAHLLAGVGWLGGIRAGAGLAGCAARAAVFGLAALPLQAAGMTAAAVAVGAGAPALALVLLRHALWPLAALGALVLVLRRPGRSAPGPRL
jgi:hypothetical protein